MKPYQDIKILRALYDKHQSGHAVAEELKVNHKTIYTWLSKFGIETKGAQGARRHHYNESYFEKIDTEEKAYWLGFIMADGCIYKGSDASSYRLQVNLKSSDIGHLMKFQEAIGSNYKIQVKKVKSCNNAEAAFLKINSTKMCKDLMGYGVVPRKSLICNVPNLDQSLTRHFIRGYFDGDGCIAYLSDRNRWSVSVAGGYDILSSIKEFMKDLFIDSALYPPRKGQKVWSLECNKQSLVRDFVSVLYKDSRVYLDRKYERYIEVAKLCPPCE